MLRSQKQKEGEEIQQRGRRVQLGLNNNMSEAAEGVDQEKRKMSDNLEAAAPMGSALGPIRPVCGVNPT